MRHAAALALLLAFADPLVAQRGGSGGGGMAGGRITRGPAAAGFPAGRFLDPEIDRPVVAAHTGPIPFPSADRQWLRAETPHFILISALGERSTRVVAHDLERLTAFLTRTSPFFRKPVQPTRVFLFAQRANAQPYFDAVGGARVDASGVTLRHPRGSTMLVDAGARGGSVSTPRHELVHDLLRRNERPLPLWIEEGLAEYYSNAGQPIREHASRLRGRLRIPIEELFAVRADTPRAWTFDFYAESWGAVATLMRRDPNAFFEFVGDVGRGADQVAALRARCHMAPRDLEVAMRNAGAPSPLMMFDEVAVTPSVTPMHRADLLYELGEMLSRIGGRAADAERHLRAAIEAAPGNEAMLAALTYAQFALSVESGERTRADALFEQLASGERANDARRLLLTADVRRADSLAREGNVLEAAKILRELAPKMPAQTRETLEVQAARLEAAATRP